MVIMKKRYITWAEKNGFLTVYNKSVTKDREGYNKLTVISINYCPECERAFETKFSDGKTNGRNRLLRPKYLPEFFDKTLGLKQSLCGETFCHNKKGN